MASLVMRTPLSSEEQATFQAQFKALDREELGVVTGEALRPLLSRSGLTTPVLSQVWALVDTEKKGFLNYTEFSAALRVIGHLQAHPGLNVDSALYDSPAPQPAKFDNLSAVSSPVAIPGGMPQSSQSSIPRVSANDISKFSQLFDRTTGGMAHIPGNKAKDIFLKAKLPTQTLGEIWALCDRDASGSLDKSEFIMAMHLIDLVLSKNPSINPVPSVVPQEVWNSIDLNGMSSPPPMNQRLSSTSTNSSINYGNATSPVPGSIPAPMSASSTGQYSINRKPTYSGIATSAFGNAADDWILTPDKKTQFDSIFDSLDKNRVGSLGSQILVNFFLSSKLSQETLATIWDLADIHNNAEFTKVEFAIAMFLIQKKNAGQELPDVIPPQLLNSPALGLNSQQPQYQASSNTSQLYESSQLSNQMLMPSRSTKPSFQEPQQTMQQPQMPQNSNNGSLSDLMDLNESFGTRVAPALGQRESSGSFNYTQANAGTAPMSTNSTGMKKFSPTSNFGQNIIQEEGANQRPAPSNPSSTDSTTVQKSVPPVPSARAASVSLPNVPNFSSFNIASTATGALNVAAGSLASASSNAANNGTYSGGNSAEFSAAATEMANLSNQVNSLTKQARITNDRKESANSELKRVNEMKSSIESKLANLRVTHERNVKETEELQAKVFQANKENEALKQELATVEANHRATEAQLNDSNQNLLNAQQENARLKEQITIFNTNMATLQTQLSEKQQKVKQEQSLVDVNKRQLEVNEITVDNLQKEIGGLDDKLKTYVEKQKELDDYKKKVEEQHAQLQVKYEEINNSNLDLDAREKQLAERNLQIQEQERLYHEHVQRLQTMFTDLSARKSSFEKADQELKAQHVEYAREIQELAEKRMRLAVGEVPDNTEIVMTQQKVTNSATPKEVSITKLDGEVEPQGTEEEIKTDSDVFDRDVPAMGSQSEADDISEGQNRSSNIAAAQALDDRFEGDLNEYRVPRTQSFTSSVANNPPQSVRDENEIPETPSAAPNYEGGNIPGQWSTSQSGGSADKDGALVNSVKQSDNEIVNSPQNSIQRSLETVVPNTVHQEEHAGGQKESSVGAVKSLSRSAIDEEFPPIRQLEINESDSSDNENSHFEDSRENPVPGNVMHNSIDDFEDEFNGLQLAAQEDEKAEPFQRLPEGNAAENSQTQEHKNMQHLVQSNDFSMPSQSAGVDEVFAGFGNGVRQSVSKQHQQQSDTNHLGSNLQPLSQPPINRSIATTPRSLAVEELSGMGFSHAEATNALEKCNWDLEAATNFLLDSA